mgnify:CR=1 FL=1
MGSEPFLRFNGILQAFLASWAEIYIGSFFVVHNVEKAEEFITDWIKEIKKGNEKHKESPALSRVSEKYDNLGNLPEQQVSYFSFENK